MEPVEIVIETHVMGLDREPEDRWLLRLPRAQLTLRELISHKVRREIEDRAAGHRTSVGKEYLSLDELTACFGPGRTGRIPGPTPLDVEKEIGRAVEAFQEGFFTVIVHRRPIEDLDGEISLTSGSRVQFLRLIPVSGGGPHIGEAPCHSPIFRGTSLRACDPLPRRAAGSCA